MNHTDLNELLDDHHSGNASTEDQHQLAEALKGDPDVVRAMVERARLEQWLQDNFSKQERPPIEMLLQERRRIPWVVGIGALAAAVMVVSLWIRTTFDIPTRVPISGNGPSQNIGRPESESWPQLLPKRSKRSNTAPAGWIARLENYILPEVDVRGLPVSQAIEQVVEQVHEIGFDGETGELIVDYPKDPNGIEPTTQLNRAQLPLLDTLRYLAAVGGVTEVELGKEICFQRSAVSQGPTKEKLIVPSNFFQVSGGPDYMEIPVEEPESIEVTEAEMISRIGEWGIQIDDPLMMEYDDGRGVVSMMGSPAQHAALSAASGLAENKRQRINVEVVHYVIPERDSLDIHIEADQMEGDGIGAVIMGNVDPEAFKKQMVQGTQVSYPAVLTLSGREVTMESVSEQLINRSDMPESAVDWTGTKFKYLPTLHGERIQME
ncbi:MAG: anti-sigma factor family protein, partial [Verrucomicrobiales bacterium]